jgi:hypothetical protein
MQKERRSITPETAVKILKEHGTIVSIQEAQIILDLMYKIGKLAVNQCITHTNTYNTNT